MLSVRDAAKGSPKGPERQLFGRWWVLLITISVGLWIGEEFQPSARLWAFADGTPFVPAAGTIGAVAAEPSSSAEAAGASNRGTKREYLLVWQETPTGAMALSRRETGQIVAIITSTTTGGVVAVDPTMQKHYTPVFSSDAQAVEALLTSIGLTPGTRAETEREYARLLTQCVTESDSVFVSDSANYPEVDLAAGVNSPGRGDSRSRAEYRQRRCRSFQPTSIASMVFREDIQPYPR